MIYLVQVSSKYLLIPESCLQKRTRPEAFMELSLEELSSELSRLKEKDLTIFARFPTNISELLVTPRLPKHLERDVLFRELKKRAPEIASPVFTYRLISETVVEGKPQQMYFISVLDHGDLAPLITEVVKAKKICRFISPLPLLVAEVLSQLLGKEPCLLICDFISEKYHYLYIENKIAFIRHVPSENQGFSEYDIENITHTLAYCRETLRIFPHTVYFSTSEPLSLSNELPGLSTKHLELNIDNTLGDTLGLMSYALTAYNQDKSRYTWLNFLPDQYKVLRLKTIAISLLSIIMALSILLTIPFIGLDLYNIRTEKHTLEALEAQLLAGKPAIEAYRSAKQQLDELIPAITFHNSMVETIQIHPIIEKISKLNIQSAQITKIDFKKEKGYLIINLIGTIKAESNADAYAEYNKTVDQLALLCSCTISNKVFDIKSKVFNISFRMPK